MSARTSEREPFWRAEEIFAEIGTAPETLAGTPVTANDESPLVVKAQKPVNCTPLSFRRKTGILREPPDLLSTT